LIYKDQFGQYPGEPIEHVIDGIRITIRILHQTGKGLRDIRGADLLYEIEDEKYALIQYKSPRKSDGRVAVDKEQLKELIGTCPGVCFYKKKRPTQTPVRMNGYCGCWYTVRSATSSSYMHACEAQHIFGERGTAGEREFQTGLRKDEFERLFAICRIGALTSVKGSKFYINKALDQGDMVFHVVQHGCWRRC
jgi:hypothetical protein